MLDKIYDGSKKFSGSSSFRSFRVNQVDTRTFDYQLLGRAKICLVQTKCQCHTYFAR